MSLEFYDSLGHQYDRMIHWKARLERETPFFQRLFGELRVKRVLDLGTGTGHHARLFRKWGCEVVGVDPSEKLLEVARGTHTNSLGLESESGDKLSFVQGDFSNFSRRVDGTFDAILSLGNALPHLLEDEGMEELLTQVFAKLNPGGAFVFQNRNYDRLMESQERFQFPSTSRGQESEEIFFRFNDFLDNRVRFNVVHFTRVGERWIHEVHSTMLRPWKHEEMEGFLKQAGFGALAFYGDFSGSPFDTQSSSDLIGIARKPRS